MPTRGREFDMLALNDLMTCQRVVTFPLLSADHTGAPKPTRSRRVAGSLGERRAA